MLSPRSLLVAGHIFQAYPRPHFLDALQGQWISTYQSDQKHNSYPSVPGEHSSPQLIIWSFINSFFHSSNWPISPFSHHMPGPLTGVRGSQEEKSLKSASLEGIPAGCQAVWKL